MYALIGAVHKVRHAILANFDPHLPCYTLSHILGQKVRHTSRTPSPIFSRPSTKNPDKSPLNKFSVNCLRGFCPGGLSGGLLSGVVFYIPPYVRIHQICYNRKLNIT